jgi:uncharacterized protein YqeY
MSVKKRIESDLLAAMKASDDLRKRTLRMALSSIRLAEIDKGSELDEGAAMAVLHKEVKARQEAISEAQRAQRPDLEAASQAEISVLEEYLPKPFSPEELEELARQAIAEVGATSPREMGLVMKTLMPRLQGRAAGDQASQVVRKLLG